MLMTHLAEHWRESDPDVARELLQQANTAQARADRIKGIAAAHPALSEEKMQAQAK
jgi:hypothetical protein